MWLQDFIKYFQMLKTKENHKQQQEILVDKHDSTFLTLLILEILEVLFFFSF